VRLYEAIASGVHERAASAALKIQAAAEAASTGKLAAIAASAAAIAGGGAAVVDGAGERPPAACGPRVTAHERRPSGDGARRRGVRPGDGGCRARAPAAQTARLAPRVCDRVSPARHHDDPHRAPPLPRPLVRRSHRRRRWCAPAAPSRRSPAMNSHRIRRLSTERGLDRIAVHVREARHAARCAAVRSGRHTKDYVRNTCASSSRALQRASTPRAPRRRRRQADRPRGRTE
jgi:hypothetical protein